MRKPTVLVFGVFDHFHLGHEAFLSQAAMHGDVYVAVARDSASKAIKGHSPRQSQDQRLEAVRASKYVSGAMLGDEKQGTYSAIEQFKPSVICVGYDQGALYAHVKQWLKDHAKMDIELMVLEPFKPEEYKSSKYGRINRAN